MWKSCILASSLLCLLSCHRWNDQDLYLPEAFINDQNNAFIIVKNQGDDKISQDGIKLTVIWDQDQKFEFLLDTMDPHFRNPKDSSIIKLPVTVHSGSHTIFAFIDTENVLNESNEDQNYYSRTIIPELNKTASTYQSPLSNKSFNKDLYLEKMQSLPFANQVIWYEGDKPFILSFWQMDWKNELLQNINAYYQNSFSTIQDTFDLNLPREVAFEIFLKYIAHALVIDHEKLVPWKVTDFKPGEIGFLWNSKNYFSYDSIRHSYQWNYESGGGIKALSPLVTFAFSQSLNQKFTNSSEAIKYFLNWSRAYLKHTESLTKIQYQSPVSILYPLKGDVHKTESCWATSGLLFEYSKALNIPISKSSIPLHNGLHAQISYPADDIYISHADDIYDPLFYPIGYPVPILNVNLKQNEYKRFISIEKFCNADSCHTEGDQHTYDRRRYLITNALNSKSGYLHLALHDNELKSVLRGDEFPNLLVPLFSDVESKLIENALKQERPNIKMLKTLYQRYLASKNNTR